MAAATAGGASPPPPFPRAAAASEGCLFAALMLYAISTFALVVLMVSAYVAAVIYGVGGLLTLAGVYLHKVAIGQSLLAIVQQLGGPSGGGP